MRIEGVRYYPNRTLQFQIIKLTRRYQLALDLKNKTKLCKGRLAHIAKQIARVTALMEKVE